MHRWICWDGPCGDTGPVDFLARNRIRRASEPDPRRHLAARHVDAATSPQRRAEALVRGDAPDLAALAALAELERDPLDVAQARQLGRLTVRVVREEGSL